MRKSLLPILCGTVLFVLMFTTSAMAEPATTEPSNEIPLPFGIRLVGYYQSQDMTADSITFSPPSPAALIPGVSAPSYPANAAHVESEITEVNLRVDSWVMPFLNLYGIFGSVNGESRGEGLSVPVPLPPAQTALIPDSISVEYDGLVYGGGLLVALGKDNFWGTLDANYTWTDLDVADSSIETLTVSPRVGMVVSEGQAAGTVWVGAMYQRTEENQKGSVIIGNGPVDLPVDYDVRVNADKPWNFLAGANWVFNREWNAGVEVGFLGREQVMLTAEYRF